MSKQIPETHLPLLDRPVLAMLSTVMPDGHPQVHPVWCDYDGEHLRVNTARGRQKDLNLRERDYATILLIDTDDPYYWVEVRGNVKERIEGGPADEHIDRLAQKYTGQEKYPNRTPGEVRVMYRIEPDRVVAAGEKQE